MTHKSNVAPDATARNTSAFADYTREFGSLLFEAAQRLYEARMEKAQMRLAHTRYLDGSPSAPKNSTRFG